MGCLVDGLGLEEGGTGVIGLKAGLGGRGGGEVLGILSQKCLRCVNAPYTL